MPASLSHEDVKAALAAARSPKQVTVVLPGGDKSFTRPFPSPADWRDHWIYFLMIDRFNNPAAPPDHPWDRATSDRQGGTFEGVRAQLAYLENLRAGAIWLTPVLKNPLYEGSHHGYGIQDFLEVDPRFGSGPGKAEEEFIRLVDESHARGLYVILDVVINDTGDVFAYDRNGQFQRQAPWSSTRYAIRWRDETGTARTDWPTLPDQISRHAAIWPAELQQNAWFRRQGSGGPVLGDFASLKEFETEQQDNVGDHPVWNLLIRIYQYAIAKFDVDGFRIDTLKHVEREFALIFCNAIREYAYSIGKKNFFIFGETKSDDEKLIAAYTGRYTSEQTDQIGADAALDFPLEWKLTASAKGFAPASTVAELFALRKEVHRQRHLLSTHGEASRFFVTFLDNDDDDHRFLYPKDGGEYSRQLAAALGCLFGLQGIPCLYCGTEQGLKGTTEIFELAYDPGSQGKPEHVREALWGKPGAFSLNHPLFREIKKLAEVRTQEPALRYGRQYFRPVSGNNRDFGLSGDPGGVIAFSRILNDREVVVTANTNTAQPFAGWVFIDSRINDDQVPFKVVYSNQGTAGAGRPTSGPVTFHDGGRTDGWARRIYVKLAPMEIQIPGLKVNVGVLLVLLLGGFFAGVDLAHRRSVVEGPRLKTGNGKEPA